MMDVVIQPRIKKGQVSLIPFAFLSPRAIVPRSKYILKKLNPALRT